MADSSLPEPVSIDSEGLGGPALAALVPLEELQRIQDAFAGAIGVAGVIVTPDGRPLTRPSGGSRVCHELVGTTRVGREACDRSDALLCTADGRAPVMHRCLGAGLWAGGAGIFVGRHRVANWLIGDVRDEAESVDALMAHADVLGLDRDAYRAALAQVPAMSVERFRQICELLLVAANQVSQLAWANQLMIDDTSGTRRDERQREAHLRRSQKLQAVGQLAGGIAHDFNNLLTVILGNTALIALDGHERLGEGEQNLLREVEAAANRAASLTRQLLAFSRRQDAAPAKVDVCSALRAFESMLRRVLAPNVRLDLRLVGTPIEVLINKGQLEQAVLNLAVNAQDAMPEGGALEISVARVDVGTGRGSLTSGTYARLRVRDEGTGIEPEHMERIFEPFFTTKEPGMGTGLGLATVFGVVEQAGGRVLVESAPGRGATFDVYLPVAQRDEALEPVRSAAGGE